MTNPSEDHKSPGIPERLIKNSNIGDSLTDIEYRQYGSVVQEAQDRVACAALKLVCDWMRANPGRGKPKLIIRWPDDNIVINKVVVMIDPSSHFGF